MVDADHRPAHDVFKLRGCGKGGELLEVHGLDVRPVEHFPAIALLRADDQQVPVVRRVQRLDRPGPAGDGLAGLEIEIEQEDPVSLIPGERQDQYRGDGQERQVLQVEAEQVGRNPGLDFDHPGGAEFQ